jgi:hypothetical protein
MKTLHRLPVWGFAFGYLVGCNPPPAPPAAKDAAPQVESKAPPAIAAEISPEKPSHPDASDKSQATIAAPDDAPETPAGADDADFELEADFTPLSLKDFAAFDAEPETWTATADGLRCTGKPKGYLYSHVPHRNFTWKLEYRFDRPPSLKDETKFAGNTGFLVYINGEHKRWPLCLEVQGKHAQLAAIKENGGAAPVTVQEDAAARDAARSPVGQWNRIEIVSKDGSLTANLNDVVISRSEPNFLSEGLIGIQAEDHPFIVRRMRLRDE